MMVNLTDKGVKEIVNDFDLFYIDIWGVLHNGIKLNEDAVNVLSKLDDQTEVYCGHEYSLNNLNFLLSIFKDNNKLYETKSTLLKKITKNKGITIPFNLGKEKLLNPFLSHKNEYYRRFIEKNNFTSLQMFSYLRDLRNKF